MTTFQRCTDRGMADRLRREREARGEEEADVVFGAVDEDGFTARQIRGAALAGSVAGSLVGGPMGAAAVGAVTGAVVASYAAAKRECELGEMARGAGDLAADTTEKLLINETVRQTVDQCSKGANRVQENVARVNESFKTKANHVNESVKATASSVHESVKSTVHKSSLRASQMKESVLVKAKSKMMIPLRRRRGNEDGLEDDSEFHDCFDDDEDIEDLDFEDAAEVAAEDEPAETVLPSEENSKIENKTALPNLIGKILAKGQKEKSESTSDGKPEDGVKGKRTKEMIGNIITTATSAMTSTSKIITMKMKESDSETDTNGGTKETTAPVQSTGDHIM